MDGLMTKTAGQVATRNPRAITPDTLAAEAVALMSGRITALFVLEADGSPVGLLHLHDCLRAGVL